MKKLALLAAALLSLSSASAQTAYIKEIEKWRSDQETDCDTIGISKRLLDYPSAPNHVYLDERDSENHSAESEGEFS